MRLLYAIILIYTASTVCFASCQEIWHVDAGVLTHKGKAGVVEDAFDSMDNSRAGSRTASRLASRNGSKANSPASSVAPSAANSDAEEGQTAEGSVPMPIVKKKKLTRKQQKDRDERRRLRTIAFLSNSIPGAVREPDTDSD